MMAEAKTKDIKLAAFLLAGIPGSVFHIDGSSEDPRRVISISIPTNFQEKAQDLTTAYINCDAVVNLYAYNRALNQIRDQLLKGGSRWNR